jgi:hypothetical protein
MWVGPAGLSRFAAVATRQHRAAGCMATMGSSRAYAGPLGNHERSITLLDASHPGNGPSGCQPHLDHLVVVPPAGLLHLRDPGLPRAVTFVALPGEQVPDDAACQLDQRRRPRCLSANHDSSMRNRIRHG